MARIIARAFESPGLSRPDLIAGDRQVVAPGAEPLQIEGDVPETAVPHRLDDLLPTRDHGRRTGPSAPRSGPGRLPDPAPGRHPRSRGSAEPPRPARSSGAPHPSRRHRTPIATPGRRPRACPRSRGPGLVRGPGPRAYRAALPRAEPGTAIPRRPLARPVVAEVVEVHAQQERPAPQGGVRHHGLEQGFLAEGAAIRTVRTVPRVLQLRRTDHAEGQVVGLAEAERRRELVPRQGGRVRDHRTRRLPVDLAGDRPPAASCRRLRRTPRPDPSPRRRSAGARRDHAVRRCGRGPSPECSAGPRVRSR